ncbi:MAG TPA: efflux RND transporter periplasmic adaptor subunit [Candidatus Baltobacteraceae bacterium]|nr:efflux RND transporter periplasmic adaptor subunit [Candidatus Baltobacteraceae bacterium]
MSAQSLPLPAGFPGLGAFGQLFSRVPRWLLAALAALLIVVLIAGTLMVRARSAVQVVTAPVVQQTLTQSVTASGTVNPQNSISVGTQVSGTISQLYVDYNSKVTKGEVLARIDPSTIQDQLDQAQANLAQAQAEAAEAGANTSAEAAGANAAQTAIPKAQAALTVAQEQLTRDQTLLSEGYIAQETVQQDQSTVAQDEAAVAQAQAAYAQTQAQTQAQGAGAQAAQAAAQAAAATVAQDQVNLNNTVITSPVTGTVVARDVSIGQTVAASLQTPTLFLIAQNLNQMEVDINVGEPDIGGVKQGDNVDFTVLAYPNQVFHGKVTQVRINPTTVNNVVTYDVVVDVDNTTGQLLPGMTANATIDVASAPNALVVPVTAVHATLRQAQGDTAAASPWGGGASTASAVTQGEDATLMVQQGKKLVRVPVQVGLVTSTQAAVSPLDGATLSAGENVVTSMSGGSHKGNAKGNYQAQHAQSGSSNPLAGGGTPSRGATRGIQ